MSAALRPDRCLRAALPRRSRRGRCADVLALAEPIRGALAGRQIEPPTERTACLITYGDGIRRRGEAPLHTLAGFLDEHVGDVVSDVHLLPMFPWTSDDGFAVVDHRAVNPALGTLGRRGGAGRQARRHVRLRRQPHLEQQPVVPWLAGRRPGYDGYYVERDPDFDDSPSSGLGPRPLYHAFPRPDGTKAWAWTTFGEDQVDVDVRKPRTLLELTDVLLGYLGPGRSAVRLDAIGFLWKESGTTVPAPPADPRGDQAVARARGPRGAGRPAAHRDQRPARREHRLLRRRPRRGADRLPVRAAAAGAALLRRRARPRG